MTSKIKIRVLTKSNNVRAVRVSRSSFSRHYFVDRVDKKGKIYSRADLNFKTYKYKIDEVRARRAISVKMRRDISANIKKSEFKLLDKKLSAMKYKFGYGKIVLRLKLRDGSIKNFKIVTKSYSKLYQKTLMKELMKEFREKLEDIRRKYRVKEGRIVLLEVHYAPYL